MVALARRRSTREFSPASLSPQQLGGLLWAANGINRADTGERTPPFAHGVHEIEIFAALREGVYRYDPMSLNESEIPVLAHTIGHASATV
ncbi:nitroreductase [Pandoraea capi]|uniref:Nitroreductase n=1 Tax=Pandoraea capi TaxID=2508286 RepID=A0ABY6WBX1_9BURK|nr:nitroreductase [Pandoraea capi]